jgi:hypothetical protein
MEWGWRLMGRSMAPAVKFAGVELSDPDGDRTEFYLCFR